MRSLLQHRRTLSQAGSTPAAGVTTIGAPTSRHRFEYLARPANVRPDELPIHGDESHSIEASTDASVPSETLRIRSDVEHRFKRVMDILAANRLITPEEAEAGQPAIELTVNDRR